MQGAHRTRQSALDDVGAFGVDSVRVAPGRPLRGPRAWLAPLVAVTLAGFAGLAAVAATASDLRTQPHFEPVGLGAIPRGVVATIAQDRQGFLWIATGDGLVRYDGYRFRPQERDGAPPAQRNLGWIRALLPARDGRLWIGTEVDGLAVHEPATGQVHLHPDTAQEGDGSHAPATIVALAEGADGAIWVGSLGGGLDRVDPQSGLVAHYRHTANPGSLPDDRVQALRIDARGALWVGTWQGLSRLAPGSDRFETVFSTPSANGVANLAGQRVTALLQAADGRLWVGTQSGDLALVDPVDLQARMLPAPGGRPRGAVASMVEAPGAVIWVGTDLGIDLMDAHEGRSLQSLRHDPRLHAGLGAGEVTTLLVDRAGWIWIAGFGFGLQRHNPDDRVFRVHGPELLAGSPWAGAVSQLDVRSLLQLEGGEVWAALHDQGIAVLDTRMRTLTTLTLPDAGGAARVGAMAQAADGSIWLGSQAVVHQYGRGRRLLRSLRHGGSATQALAAGADGSVWVGTDDGLYRWLPGGAALQRMTLAGGQPLGGPVFALALAVGGGLWVGTARGLYRVAPGSAEMRAVVAAPDRGLGNAVVIGLLLDRQHRLWVDTAVTGLHRLQRWDGQQAEFDRVSQRHGILSRPFGANLMEDRRGRIWTHMAVYDPTSDQLDELSAADGVNFGTGWFHVHAQTADGRLLFGGSRGLLEVDPEGFVASAYAPPVVITELRVNGEPQPLPSAQRLRIEPGQRSFSIEFAALDYADPGRNRYAYQLQGFDPDWIPTGAELRVASYSNLDPGRYRLRVRGSNRSGLWSPQELDLELQVLPAWWQHWGFRLALLALLSGLAYALLQLRTQQMRQRQGVLEGRVRDRTAELEAITQALRQESTALAEASLTDPLTGLRNRRFLAMHIGQDVALALRRHDHRNQQGAPSPDDADLIFFLVDIDLFKQANDRHGHAAGDSVLVQMRSRLLEVFRDSDHLVRWGGEEFLVVARDSTRRHVAALAERARAAVADRPFVLPDGTLLTRTCSIGFCCFPLAPALGGVLDWSAAVLSADAALYAVKSAGRNGWLGLLAARAESPEALCQRARGPLADWARSGELTVAHSAAHGHWADALTAGS